MSGRLALIAVLALLPSAAFAQHEGHGGHDDHAGHAEAAGSAETSHVTPNPASAESAPSPHHQHATSEPTETPTFETPAPSEAGEGPSHAADAIWGADAMRPSRAALRRDHGAMSYTWFMADRAEYRARAGHDGYLWDTQAFHGGDLDKLWLKSEGEGAFGGEVELAEVQALWSHAVAPFFDMQAGVRQDLAGPSRTHAVIGIQGLAPYRFELDAAAFLSDRGELTGRIEAELDERITQRLILQPRIELGLSAQNIPQLGIGSGLDRAELGLRLRYEIAREFAPYVGVEQEWRIGRGATYARAAGHDPSATFYVVGIRFWF